MAEWKVCTIQHGAVSQRGQQSVRPSTMQHRSEVSSPYDPARCSTAAKSAVPVRTTQHDATAQRSQQSVRPSTMQQRSEVNSPYDPARCNSAAKSTDRTTQHDGTPQRSQQSVRYSTMEGRSTVDRRDDAAPQQSSTLRHALRLDAAGRQYDSERYNRWNRRYARPSGRVCMLSTPGFLRGRDASPLRPVFCEGILFWRAAAGHPFLTSLLLGQEGASDSAAGAGRSN